MFRPYFAMGRRPPRRRPAPTRTLAGASVAHPAPTKRKKPAKAKRVLFVLLILIIGLGYLFTMIANRSIMPAVITIANQRSVALFNQVINDSLLSTISQFELVSEDFFTMRTEADGQLTHLAVDTILITQVTAQLAVDISEGLSDDESASVRMPIGMLTGIPLLAGIGPSIPISVIPMGEARVEYHTSFASAGINQINFQVWLYVETDMRIVIPLQEEIVPVSRRVPLVNTVFAGEVPEGMFLTNFGLN
ncbi:MAG: sporulation protein YunB [Defluviitaleaceae bacterium]|nr:sporulation protein YunB [Defluviitaleaceae bacterium]